jgi:carbon monoxide dehydrogenase subunit G
MRPRPTARLALAAAMIGLASAPPARAEDAPEVAPFSPAELAGLDHGDVVKRPLELDLPGGIHVAGLSYAVIAAPPAAVWSALLDARTYLAILPLTMEAREVDRRGDERWVVLRHGVRWASVAYTAHVVPTPEDGTVRFWLDPDRPHEVDDAWGFFRVEARSDGRTLLSYGAVVDLGHGFAGLFFKEKIRRHALETPRLLRRWVEEHTPRPAPPPPAPPVAAR